MIVLFFLLGIHNARAEDLYVKSLKAPVVAEPKVGAATKAMLDRNAQVKVQDKTGAFYKVSASGAEGFINAMFLSSTPADSKGLLSNENVDIESKARKRASGFTSAAAARGLKEDSDDIFKSLGDANAEEIKKMESYKTSEKAGLEFLSNPTLKL